MSCLVRVALLIFCSLGLATPWACHVGVGCVGGAWSCLRFGACTVNLVYFWCGVMRAFRVPGFVPTFFVFWSLSTERRDDVDV